MVAFSQVRLVDANVRDFVEPWAEDAPPIPTYFVLLDFNDPSIRPPSTRLIDSVAMGVVVVVRG